MRKEIFAAILFVTFMLLACSGRQSKNPEGELGPAYLIASEVSTGLDIGQRAPEMTFSSPDGKSYSLSSLRGKIVLIDFWAAWCLPCRIENPNLVKIYSQYENKKFTRGRGFTIYSVSLDTDKESWEMGIEKDRLEWEYHVSDLKGWHSEAASMYKIESIPANFLIDGDGIIIAKDLRAEALGEMMESLLR